MNQNNFERDFHQKIESSSVLVHLFVKVSQPGYSKGTFFSL